MNNFLLRLGLGIVCLIVLSSDCVLAETSSADPSYPGELKELPNGKQVKLWSTKGPVPVSQASEPFETRREKSIPANAFINIGGTQQQGAVKVPSLKENKEGHQHIRP